MNQRYLCAGVPGSPRPPLPQKFPSCHKTIQRDEVKNGGPGRNCKGSLPCKARKSLAAASFALPWPGGTEHTGTGPRGWEQAPSPIAFRPGVSKTLSSTAAKREKQLHWSLHRMGEAVGHSHSPLPLRCPVSSSALYVSPSLTGFPNRGQEAGFPWRFNVFSMLHMQEACPWVPFAKQARSHLHQSLELSNTENLEYFLNLTRGGGGGIRVCCCSATAGNSFSLPPCALRYCWGLIPDFTSHVSIYRQRATVLHTASGSQKCLLPCPEAQVSDLQMHLVG